MIEYKTVSLASQIYETLELNILNGTYAQGEVLTESRLSEELGVSRTPIREAMARLAHEKLIADSPNGIIVIGITNKDVEDIFEVKRRIEVLATKWAAENIDDEALKELKDILDQQEFYSQKGDAEKVRNLDTQFHDVIYRESGSSVIEGILSPMHKKMLKYRKVSLEKSHRISDSVKEHEAIYNALVSRDVKQVEKLMLVHIENSGRSMMEGRA